MTDGEVNTSEVPVLEKEFFQRARLRHPERRVGVTVPIDFQVLAWFQAQGEDYENRLNAALPPLRRSPPNVLGYRKYWRCSQGN